MRTTVTLLALLATGLAGVAPSSAESQSFRADYLVTFLGLPVGSASFDSTYTRNSFRIDGTLRSRGIASLFDNTSGTTRAEGAIGREGLKPSAFSITYAQGKRKGSIAIGFSGDRVASTAVTPKPKPRDEKRWVTVSRGQLRAVLDPLSAMVVRADSPDQVCNRTVSYFDGEMRGDVKLSPRGVGSHPGFKGVAVTCDARFVPVSGFYPSRTISYMRDRSRMTLTLVQLGQTGLYAPVDATVGTPVGSIRVQTRRIEAR